MLFKYEDEDIGRFSNLHQCSVPLEVVVQRSSIKKCS